jgi:hypothetical protein
MTPEADGYILFTKFINFNFLRFAVGNRRLMLALSPY